MASCCEGRSLAYVALGANLGDGLATLEAACLALAELPHTCRLAQSSIHRTKPVGGPAGQPNYWNAVVSFETRLTPLELLDELQRIETQFGRERGREERWGARRLDLDLLLHGDARMTSERLELPHPRMHERRFVLEPLAELAPELRLASGHSVRELCASLPAVVQP